MSEPVVRYSVLVPVYNSENSIRELWQRIQEVFSRITQDYEVVMVDDGSRDGVWCVMKEIAGKDRRAPRLCACPEILGNRTRCCAD